MLRKNSRRFTDEQLDVLMGDVNSCITINNTTYSLALFPYHLSNVSESVKRLLNLIIGKYDQRLDGILLGYKNLKLITPYASLRADRCYIHVDIQGDFFLFKPNVGSLLTGVVNKISSSHIGCLVHHIFNVSVPNTDEDENWIGFDVKLQDVLGLCITKMDLDGRLPYIQASIDSVISRTKKSKINSTIDNSPKKQKKHLNGSSDVVDNNNESLLDEAEISLNSPKKKKKKKHSENDSSIQPIEDTPNLNESKKQKKKRLSQAENNEETEETPNLNETKKQNKKRLSQAENNEETKETPNLNESKKQKKKRLSQTENNQTEETLNLNIVEPSPETKKQKKKNRHSDKIENLDIKVEELSQKTLILNKSQKTQSQELDTNKITPKKQTNQIPNDSQRTNESDYFVTPKTKKKQKQTPEKIIEKTPEATLEKGSLEDFIPKEKKNKKRNSNNTGTSITKTDSTKKKKKQKEEINIEELQNTLLMEQLKSIGGPIKEKKRKSKEVDKSDQKPIILSPVKPMADLEDRKSKKRRQSLSQNVNWENKELHLYDSDLEKTLNTPSDANNILDNFNLAKIQALNADTPRKLKRKRKNEVVEDEFVSTVKKSKNEY